VWTANLWAHYRLRPSDYYQLLREQDGRCAICGIHDQEVPVTGSGRPRLDGPAAVIHRLVVDHCHRTNRVRGLLCPTCNSGLGQFRESIARLEGAIAYLRRLGAEPLPEPPGRAQLAVPEPGDGLW
jgi:hypothetical protein